MCDNLLGTKRVLKKARWQISQKQSDARHPTIFIRLLRAEE